MTSESTAVPPCCGFFFNDTATTEIYTLSLHDALPICDEEIYANCVARLRNRLNVIDEVLSGKLVIPHQEVLAEVIFIQFRKSLEEIAFASLSANKNVYSAVHRSEERRVGKEC